MRIEHVNSYDELSLKAKDYIVQAIKENKNLLLCTATGSTPIGTYQRLIGEFHKNPDLFSRLRIIKLDEWGGIPIDQPGTCESYLQKHLLKPLNISESRYIGFNSNPKYLLQECKTIQNKLKEEGPIDLCILGIGENGHIAFNEPNDFLQPYCHISKLSNSSLQHKMTSGMEKKPTFGLTLGISDILQSKKILLLINGFKKREVTKKFLSQRISTFLPASFLWLHPKVTCFIENSAMDAAE